MVGVDKVDCGQPDVLLLQPLDQVLDTEAVREKLHLCSTGRFVRERVKLFWLSVKGQSPTGRGWIRQRLRKGQINPSAASYNYSINNCRRLERTVLHTLYAGPVNTAFAKTSLMESSRILRRKYSAIEGGETGKENEMMHGMAQDS